MIPVSGGIFIIHVYTRGDAQSTDTALDSTSITEHLIWDRKRDGGFPETKELKGRVRNIVEPDKDMGHIDRALKRGKPESQGQEQVHSEVTESVLPVGEARTRLDSDRDGTGIASVEAAGTIDNAVVDKGKSDGHQHSVTTVADCAECMAAVKEDEMQGQPKSTS